MHWPKDKNNQMFFCFATNKFSPYNHVQLPQQHPLPYYPGPRPSWMEEEGRSLLDPPSTMAGSRFWFTNSCTDSPSTGTFAAGRNGDFYPGFSTTKMGQNSPPPKKKTHEKATQTLEDSGFPPSSSSEKPRGVFFNKLFLEFEKATAIRFHESVLSTWPRSNLAALWAPRVGIMGSTSQLKDVQIFP